MAILATVGLLGLLIILLVIGFTSDLLRRNYKDRQTSAALAQAKEALIGYAANYRDTHPGQVFGYLPCPDMDGAGFGGEGGAEGSCGAKDVTAIGRLPWKTLGLPPLRDGDEECLWYAVSGNFKNNPQTNLMNWDTNGLIEVMAPDGVNFVAGGSGATAVPTVRAAAAIFAAGAILPGQDRSLATTNPPTTCGGNYNPANYLDTDAASGINNATATSAAANALSRYIAATNSDLTPATNDLFNDKLLVVTPNDIFAGRVEKRSDFFAALTDPPPVNGMLWQVASCVAQYGQTNAGGANDRRLPWAAPFATSNYGIAGNYDDGTGQYSGRLPYSINNSVPATNNTVFGSGILLSSGVCAALATPEFWQNWKEHVFYAVAEAYSPANTNI
ncbi:MAG TPA: hypothetical protein VFB20_02380, partial [Burkholderiales bacterium]|nr:hypothetical protein [Burkholderiales bacterium]